MPTNPTKPTVPSLTPDSVINPVNTKVYDRCPVSVGIGLWASARSNGFRPRRRGMRVFP